MVRNDYKTVFFQLQQLTQVKYLLLYFADQQK